jgi:hypothetical protein
MPLPLDLLAGLEQERSNLRPRRTRKQTAGQQPVEQCFRTSRFASSGPSPANPAKTPTSLQCALRGLLPACPSTPLPESGFDARQVVGVRAEGRRLASCSVIEPVAAFACMRTGQAASRGRGKGYSASVSRGRSGGGPGMLHHFSEEMRLSLDALEDRPPA